jgi:hypothetical protein
LKVCTGGWLFEEWFESMAPIRVRGLFHKEISQARQHNVTKINNQFSNLITQKFGTYFQTYILLSLRAMGTSVQQQLFYSTMVMDYRGASRTGLDIINKKGLGLPLTTYDRYLKAALLTSQEQIQ